MIDYLDFARFARHFRNTRCPVCKLDWQCGQDVRERSPMLLDGAAYCGTCFLAVTEQAPDWFEKKVGYCMSRSEDLPTIDQAFLNRIAGLRNNELDDQDMTRLLALLERLEND